MTPHPWRRFGAAVAAATLTASLAAVSSPAQATTTTPALTEAAGWLSSQLTDGVLNSGGYTDVGTTIWAARALEVEGDHASTIGDIVSAVGSHLSGPSGYLDADEYDFNPPYALVQHGYYATPAANALVFAQDEGQDPAAYDGVDVLQALKDRLIGTGPSAGRIADDSSFGDYANTIGQALAVLGLTRAHDASAPAAQAFLLQQQCSAGYFRLNFASDKSAADQSCDGGSASGASPADPDATSLVILELKQLDTPDQTVTTAIDRAVAWLRKQQHADGSFNGGTSTNVPNANSTGLAGWALGEVGDLDAARAAAVWVRQHQVQPIAGCATKLDGAAGAIGYDDAALSAGRSKGIPADKQYQWRLASAQAAEVLQWAPTTTGSPTLSVPGGYQRAGAKVTVKAAHGTPGGALCVTAGSARGFGAAGAAGTAGIALTLPAGTANRVVRLTDGTTTRTATVKVLGKKKLAVHTPAKVKRKKKVTVKVTGLAPREKLVVSLRGKVVRRATATAKGTYTTKVAVGKKTGKAKIVVNGQFPAIRKGGHTVKVTR